MPEIEVGVIVKGSDCKTYNSAYLSVFHMLWAQHPRNICFIEYYASFHWCNSLELVHPLMVTHVFVIPDFLTYLMMSCHPALRKRHRRSIQQCLRIFLPFTILPPNHYNITQIYNFRQSRHKKNHFNGVSLLCTLETIEQCFHKHLTGQFLTCSICVLFKCSSCL